MGCKVGNGPGDVEFRAASTASADMREVGLRWELSAAAAVAGYGDERD